MLGFGSRLSVLPQRVNRAKVNHRKLRWSVRASGGSSDGNTVKKAKIYPSRSLLPALFVGASVTNRVIYRILLVPMKNYTFLVSIFVSMCYVLIYGIILNYRFRSGIVSKEMLNFARQKWKSFALIGAMEAITFTIQLYTAARLPGALIGILSQGTLPFTMIFSAIFRQKRYKPVQVFEPYSASVLFFLLPSKITPGARWQSVWATCMFIICTSNCQLQGGFFLLTLCCLCFVSIRLPASLR